jgi:serine/threonine protein kinase
MQSGQLLCNRYSIEQHLAGGGFGQTYLAVDTHLPSKPLVVVKLLNPMSNDPATLEIAQRLFNTEAETLETLGKDNDRIPSLYAYFEFDGKFYLVQEFIAGTTLTDELNPRRLSEAETISILQEILTGLSRVHSQNIIHRDLKPDNIIRRAKDRKLVLIDFGAVKQVRAVTMMAPNPASRTIGIGTEGYMPSEQGLGYPKPASDIYAVGAIGIQCLTGSAPHFLFNEDSLSIEWQHLIRINRDFAKVLNKMVSPDYRQRYANATEALKAIESLNISLSQPIKPPTSVQLPIVSPVITSPVVGLLSTQHVRLKSRIFPTRKDFFSGCELVAFTVGTVYMIWVFAINFNPMAEFAEPVVTPSPSQPLPILDQATVTPKSSKKLPPLLDNPEIASTFPTASSTLDESVVLPTAVSKSLSQLSSQVSALEKATNKSKALSPAEKAKLTSIKAQLIAANNNIKSGNIANAKTQFEKIHFSGLDIDYYSTESIGKTNYSMWDIGRLIQEVELDIMSSVEDIDSVQTSKNLTEAIRVINDVTQKSKPLIIKGK